MKTSGAQPGNQSASKPRRWSAAIDAALKKRGTDKLDALEAIADSLLTLAMKGDMQAMRELGDRLDGKPHQTVSAEVDATVNVTVKQF